MSQVSFRTVKRSEAPKRASLGRMVNQSTMLLMICIGVLILTLALLILFHENANATRGYNLRKLENQRSVLLLEQEVLNMEIAESQALEHLETDDTITKMIPYSRPRYVKRSSIPKSSSSSSVSSTLPTSSSSTSTSSSSTSSSSSPSMSSR